MSCPQFHSNSVWNWKIWLDSVVWQKSNFSGIDTIYMSPPPDRDHTTDQSMDITKVQFHLAMCLIRVITSTWVRFAYRRRNDSKTAASTGDSPHSWESRPHVTAASRSTAWSMSFPGASYDLNSFKVSILVSFSPRQMVWSTWDLISFRCFLKLFWVVYITVLRASFQGGRFQSWKKFTHFFSL